MSIRSPIVGAEFSREKFLSRLGSRDETFYYDFILLIVLRSCNIDYHRSRELRRVSTNTTTLLRAIIHSQCVPVWRCAIASPAAVCKSCLPLSHRYLKRARAIICPRWTTSVAEVERRAFLECSVECCFHPLFPRTLSSPWSSYVT
jgi:hypothetical protein